MIQHRISFYSNSLKIAMKILNLENENRKFIKTVVKNTKMECLVI